MRALQQSFNNAPCSYRSRGFKCTLCNSFNGTKVQLYQRWCGNRSSLWYIRIPGCCWRISEGEQKDEIFFDKQKKDHYMNHMFHGYDMDRTMVERIMCGSMI